MNQKQIKQLIDMDILKMSALNRYNNRDRITQENIAEHSFYVAFAVMKLSEMFEIKRETKLKALQMAILHDIPEIYTSDIPYPIKQKSPVLKKELEKLELEFMSEAYPQFFKLFTDFTISEDSDEALLVKVADAISVLQYAQKEINLGNKTEEMMEIYTLTNIRINDGIKSLEERFSTKTTETKNLKK